MTENLIKYNKTAERSFEISILIPTWNNLDLLKLCIAGIQKNSQLDLQIIVFVNEGSDGTPEWLDEQDNIDYIVSEKNIGICYALNFCRSLVKSDYILYLNDDMYVLPEWDIYLFEEIRKINTKMFMLSATMIEPVDTNNPCVVVKDYGTSIETFAEEKLLTEMNTLSRSDWSGSTFPPNIVHIDLWDAVGGLSIEFSPGMYSDPDFAHKLYDAGVRIFKGVGNSLVYHFGSKTTKRLGKNAGRQKFLMKWGITPRTFTREYLHLGKEFAVLPKKMELSKKMLLINKIKRILSALF